MEIVFLLISIMLGAGSVLGLKYLVYGTWAGVRRTYRYGDDVVVVDILFSIMLLSVYFMALCATNNTFWHLPYLTQ